MSFDPHLDSPVLARGPIGEGVGLFEGGEGAVLRAAPIGAPLDDGVSAVAKLDDVDPTSSGKS